MIRLATSFTGGLSAIDFALKYENIEYQHIFGVEIDKYARKQCISFHGEPDEFHYDVTTATATHLKGNVDLYVFGSSCQDLSLAGKRKGFNGEKSVLFRDGARLLNEMRAKAFIFENVKGLLSSNGGNDYKEVVKTFQDMGYLIASKVVNAKEHGTAQNRERVFIVGFLDVAAYHAFNFAEPFPLTKVLRDYLEDEVDEKYYLSQKMIDGFISKNDRYEKDGKAKGFCFAPADVNSHSSCLNARYYKMGAADIFIQDEPQLNQVGELDIKGADSTKRVYGDDGLCPTLTTMGGGNRQPKVLEPTVAIKSATKNGYEIATENDSINLTHPKSETRRGRVGKSVAQTLDCACNQGVIVKDEDISNPLKGKTPYGWHFEQKVYSEDSKCTRALTSSEGSGSREKVIQDYRIRRLTPKECFRLQGINDSDINLINSDTQSYKIAGNAIEVNSMRMLIRQLYKAEKLKNSLF